MVVHGNTKLTPKQRRSLADDYFIHRFRKKDLIDKYRVSYPTINKILSRARHGDYTLHTSTNKRYQTIEYGLKRLSKIEQKLEAKRKAYARRYEKTYPGELLHLDTKRHPLLDGETRADGYEYLFVAVDDYARELYVGIYPDKSQHSAADFLQSVLQQCPYTIERILTDNGKEYKGKPDEHAFMLVAAAHDIKQSFTRVKRPQTNGKAERVIRTLMEGWHQAERFGSRHDRALALVRFTNYYNCVRPHKGIDKQTPLERLYEYFYPSEKVKQRAGF
jgi:transposase InsO family protein